MAKTMLTKHEDMSFEDQFIYLRGHAYINCKFRRCTLFFMGPPSLLRGCVFKSCNWRIEYDVLWGDPDTRSALRQLIDLIDGAPDARFGQSTSEGQD